MTYDVAVWKHSGDLSDEEAAAEYDRRFELSEVNYDTDERQPPCPELVELFARMQAKFPGDPPPWEDGIDDAADGDFAYFTMSYGEGPAVVEYVAQFARSIGLVVFDPQGECVVS